jgi:uncharacterized membrane protein (DUF106 family)
MLTETFLSTVVVVGVTGAGLVLAIYALIIPISRRMFINRTRLLRRQMKEFEEQREELETKDSKKLKRLQQLADSIRETKIFPRYLSYGMLLTFSLYLTSALSGFTYFISPSNHTVLDDWVITLTFMFANLAFFFVGIYAIIDISLTMKREFERIKKRLEEDEKFSGLFVK